MFVWAHVVCGPRYGQFSWLETSPVPGKIHMQKIERLQGDSTCDKNEEFLDLETSPASKMSSGEQNRVLTHSVERITWLEELASDSKLYRHKELFLRREDWSFQLGETIYDIWSVFH